MNRSQEIRRRVLEAVANQDVTRRYCKHRWWLTEHESRTLTDAERKHVREAHRDGQIAYEGAAGYSHREIGYYVLTMTGREWLDAHPAEQAADTGDGPDTASAGGKSRPS